MPKYTYVPFTIHLAPLIVKINVLSRIMPLISAKVVIYVYAVYEA